MRDETLTASSEAMIHIASVDNPARRITNESTPLARNVLGHQGQFAYFSNALSGPQNRMSHPRVGFNER